MEKIKWAVIDNDSKESVSVETTCYETAKNWAATFNNDCHACGGSSTQYTIEEVKK